MEEDSQFDMGIKDVILKTKSYALYILKNTHWLFISAIVGAIVGIVIYTITPKNFVATTTFIVEEDESGGMGGFGSTLSMFGLAGISSGVYNYDKVVSVAKSKRVVMKSLLENIYNNDTLICNRIIDIYELSDNLEKNLKVSKITNPRTFDSLSRKEKIILNSVYSVVNDKENPLLKISYDESSKMIVLSVNSYEEMLSYSLLNSVYNNLNAFYTHQATKKYAENVSNLKVRLDSIKNEMENKEVQLARELDINNNIFTKSNEIHQTRLFRDVEILSAAYIEVLKNYESARYLLSSVRPVFTAVDKSYLPVGRQNEPKIITIIKNSFLFFILCLTFLLGKRAYNEIME